MESRASDRSRHSPGARRKRWATHNTFSNAIVTTVARSGAKTGSKRVKNVRTDTLHVRLLLPLPPVAQRCLFVKTRSKTRRKNATEKNIKSGGCRCFLFTEIQGKKNHKSPKEIQHAHRQESTRNHYAGGKAGTTRQRTARRLRTVH